MRRTGRQMTRLDMLERIAAKRGDAAAREAALRIKTPPARGEVWAEWRLLNRSRAEAWRRAAWRLFRLIMGWP